MKIWNSKIKQGIHFLSKHEPVRALKYFYIALEECPVSEQRELSRLLFYLGITLKRLGFLNAAIKSWLASQRLKKGSYALKMIKRFINDYGMEQQSCKAIDDWKAFYSIQLINYLNGKSSKRFNSPAEKDMIKDLVFDHFKSLKENGILNDKTPEEKNRIFRNVKIVFPFLFINNIESESVIHVDFFNNKKVGYNDRCSCGSGLSFRVCCGRTPGEIELLSGCF